MSKIIVLTECTPLCPYRRVGHYRAQRYSCENHVDNVNMCCEKTGLILFSPFWLKDSYKECYKIQHNVSDTDRTCRIYEV
jgi:hypothetical protein